MLAIFVIVTNLKPEKLYDWGVLYVVCIQFVYVLFYFIVFMVIGFKIYSFKTYLIAS